jgi:hypothetical protein
MALKDIENMREDEMLSLMNPLIFAGTHIGQISWTNDAD